MDEKPSILRSAIKELTQAFIDLAYTSQALLGIKFSYVLEGLSYFGIISILTIFFNENIGLVDEWSGYIVGFLIAGMGFAMLYTLINLGGFLPKIISQAIRKANGITRVYWVYAVLLLSEW